MWRTVIPGRAACVVGKGRRGVRTVRSRGECRRLAARMPELDAIFGHLRVRKVDSGWSGTI